MLKRIFKLCAVVTALLILLLAVLIGRTLTYTSKQIDVEPAPPLQLDTQAAAQKLARALTYRTISNQDPSDLDAQAFTRFHTYLQTQFPALHATLKRETVAQYSLLYTWPGADPTLKPICLLAHMDVVPTRNDAWEQPPFDGVIQDGTLWGRGALDDKGSLMAILQAVELLAAQGVQPKRTLYLSFGHDEEVAGTGAIATAQLLQDRGVQLEFVLDEGGAIIQGVLPGLSVPQAVIGIAEKGYLSLELLAQSEGGHSSQPPQETAIGILAKAIHQLETHQMPAALTGPARQMFATIGPELPFTLRLVTANLWLLEPLLISQLQTSPQMNALLRTTTAPTILTAGHKENVLPTQARAVINYRILPGDTVQSVIQHTRDTIGDPRITITPLGTPSEASKVSPTDHPTYRHIETTIRQLHPDTIVAPTLVLGGTDSRFYGNLTDNIYRFSPIQIDPQQLATIHAPNEHITIQNYKNMVHFYHQLIKNTAL